MDKILADENYWDQHAFNDLMVHGAVLEPRRKDRLFLCAFSPYSAGDGHVANSMLNVTPVNCAESPCFPLPTSDHDLQPLFLCTLTSGVMCAQLHDPAALTYSLYSVAQ